MKKLSLALIGACCVSPSVLGNSIEDIHRFRLGAYEQDVDVAGSVTVKGFPEIDLDFDKVLGLEDSSTTYFFSYQWRFKEKWSLQTFYSQMKTDGKKVATTDFNWDGEEYTVGAQLETDLALDTYLIAANYSWIRDQKKEIGVGFGLHAFDIDTTISAAIGAGGEERQRARNNTEVTAPLPNLRAYGTYMIAPKWEVSAELGWLSFSYDDYDGDYLFLNAYTEYRFTERFGIGMSYQIAEIDVTHEDSRAKEKFDMDFYGPSIFMTYGF